MSRDKIKSWTELEQLVSQAREGGARVVFTNGCFDILHAGHVQYLEQARASGDLLIVGLNSDASVRRLKGFNRPIVAQEDRAAVLAGLSCVDFVVIFEQDTPYELIRLLQPDILVKGGDWHAVDIVGADIVLERGGQVLSLPFKQGLSTSALIARILHLNDTHGGGE